MNEKYSCILLPNVATKMVNYTSTDVVFVHNLTQIKYKSKNPYIYVLSWTNEET